MSKKIVALLLCLLMMLSAIACSSGTTEEPAVEEPVVEEPVVEETEEAEPVVEEPAVVETEEAEPVVEEPAVVLPDAEELPEAFAHITFDEGMQEAEGYTFVKQSTEEDKPAELTGAKMAIIPAEGDDISKLKYGEGPVGTALFMNKFGLNLNLQPTNTDTYTVSFWLNADRFDTFSPTAQFGYDMFLADGEGDVTWFNITETSWLTDPIYPVVWSRHESAASWPWFCSFDATENGKREWVMITLVCTGGEPEIYGDTLGVGAQLYINGRLVYDCKDNKDNETFFPWGEGGVWGCCMAPDIMKPGADNTFETYFGINYWDSIYRGWVDDLYVFDTALTPGQVVSLYQMGTIPAE